MESRVRKACPNCFSLSIYKKRRDYNSNYTCQRCKHVFKIPEMRKEGDVLKPLAKTDKPKTEPGEIPKSHITRACPSCGYPYYKRIKKITENSVSIHYQCKKCEKSFINFGKAEVSIVKNDRLKLLS